jgi:hypothetical protein
MHPGIRRHISQPGWVIMKVNLEIALLTPQDNCKRPLRALYLKNSFESPSGLDYVSLNAPIID